MRKLNFAELLFLNAESEQNSRLVDKYTELVDKLTHFPAKSVP